MKKFNLLKLIFSTLLVFAATAFVSCVDDNEDTEAPYLEVAPTSVAFNTDGSPVEGDGTFTIATNRHWKIEVPNNAAWITLSKVEGDGPMTIQVSVPAGTNNTAKITVQTYNKVGPLLKAEVSITSGTVVPEEVIYDETFGDTAPSKSPYPYIDQFKDWKTTGIGAAEVTYTGASASVRQSGKLSEVYPGASGADKLFFGANANLIINKIALSSEQTNLKLTFGGSYSKNVDGVYDNAFKPEAFHVYLSADGTSWSNALNYTTEKAGDFWVYATATFSLKNAVPFLYIKYVADEASVFAIDDPTLVTSNQDGQLIDLGDTPAPGDLVVTPKEVTLGSTSGATQTVNITSAAITGWTATAAGTGYTIDQQSGHGNATLTITASAANATATAKALGSITITDATGTATVTVSQAGASSDIFHETVGTKAVSSPYPFVDQYDGWVTSGSGASGVTFGGASASIRASGLANTGAYDGASGPNVIFFGTLPASFEVKNIALTSAQTNLKLTFGASYSLKVGAGYVNTFDPAKFTVSLSANGTTWVPITYTKNNGDSATPFWVFATADFTLSKAATALYIKFEALEKSAIRLDDITLTTGAGGQSVDLSGSGTTDLTVSPASVTLAATSGATATFAVTTTAAWTASVGGAGYTINPTSGTGNATITVTASAANTGSSVKTLGDITVTNGTVTKTVAVAQSGTSSPSGNTVVVDFTSAGIATPALPDRDKDKDAVATDGTYVIGGLTYKIHAGAKFYWWTNTYQDTKPTSLFIGKTGSYIELPAKAGVALTGVVVDQAIGGGSSVQVSVKDVNGTVVGGGDALTINAGETASFGLTGTTANTSYRVYVDNEKNLHVAKLTLTYGNGGGETTTPEITAVTPSSLSFEAAGGSKTVTATIANQGSNTITASGLSGILSASVNGNTVTVSAAANTATTAVNQTLTITLAGGNSKTVPVTVAAAGVTPPPAGAVTLVTTAAGLSAGTYYMAGLVGTQYQLWTGALSYGKCVTSAYTFDSATKKLTPAATDDAVEVSLVAVSGVANAFYIKVGAQYLSVSAAGKNMFALVDTQENNYWTFSDQDKNGVKGSAKAFEAMMFTSISAKSTHIRTYTVETTTSVGGVAFFKK
ncbi:MAG: hypothetical protein RSC12_01730 [Alistipes sp.]